MPKFHTYFITDAIFEQNFITLEFYETPFSNHSLEERTLCLRQNKTFESVIYKGLNVLEESLNLDFIFRVLNMQHILRCFIMHIKEDNSVPVFIIK